MQSTVFLRRSSTILLHEQKFHKNRSNKARRLANAIPNIAPDTHFFQSSIDCQLRINQKPNGERTSVCAHLIDDYLSLCLMALGKDGKDKWLEVLSGKF